MSDQPPETSELQAFVAVVEEGSVSAAARRLEIPRATISRRIARLEERLGVRLAHRTTRSVHLTDAGEVYFDHARVAVESVLEASRAVCVADGVPRGPLRVSVPPLSDGPLRDALVDFVAAYPEVTLELIASSALLDLRAGKIDVAWRATTDLDEDLVARRLFAMDVHAVATPGYLAEYGTPASADDLRMHRCLRGFTRGERPATRWPLRVGGTVRVDGPLVSNDLRVVRDAVLRGLGIALLPTGFTQRYMDAGDLVPVLPAEVGAESQIALVFPDRNLRKPAVRAFVDHIAAVTMAGVAEERCLQES